MKKILTAIILFAMIFSLSACGNSGKGYVISYDILNEPRNLDPQTASDKASLTIISNVFEGLFYIDKSGKAAKGLAETVTKSSDGLEYTIKIIDNAKWTNGNKVTADDFVFAFQRLFAPDTNSPAAFQFYSIKNSKAVHDGQADQTMLGIKALSENELKIELEYPNENLEYLLATTYAMPCNKKFFNETKGKYGLQPDKIMSNGPFDIYSWKHNESIKIVKSDSYYDKSNVKPAGVNLYVSVKEPTIQRLANKDINAAFVSGSDIDKFNNNGYNTEVIEDTTWGLYINTQNKYLSDINIRKAISACFDRASYSKTLDKNLSVANGVIPHSIMMFDKTYREYAGESVVTGFNVKKAYEYYKNGLLKLQTDNIPALKLLINKDEKINFLDYFSYPSQIFQKELSLFINIDEVDQKEYNKRIQEKDFDIALYKLKSADNTANSIFSNFESKSDKNFISYSNQEYDKMLSEAALQTDKQKIIQGYSDLEKMIIDDGVFIPMFYATDYFVLTGETTNIIYNKRTGLISFKNAIAD